MSSYLLYTKEEVLTRFYLSKETKWSEMQKLKNDKDGRVPEKIKS